MIFTSRFVDDIDFQVGGIGIATLHEPGCARLQLAYFICISGYVVVEFSFLSTMTIGYAGLTLQEEANLSSEGVLDAGPNPT